MIGPFSFILRLTMHMFFLNLIGVGRILLWNGIPTLITVYCVYTVYTMYRLVIEQTANELPTLVTVDPHNTVYGTNGVVVVSEFVNQRRDRETPPPSYEELAETHKAHI